MERVKLYNNVDDDPSDLESSWVWDISWNGSLIIRRYEDIEQNNKTIRRVTPMKYNVSYDVFEEIVNSNSKGSAINRLVIRNKNVEKAKVSDSVKEFEI